MHAATGDFNRNGRYHRGSEWCRWTRRRNYLATPGSKSAVCDVRPLTAVQALYTYPPENLIQDHDGK
jgi:hypothetical protein